MELDRARGVPDLVEVRVVADRPHRLPDGRVDRSATDLRGVEAGRDRVGQQRTHDHRRAGTGIERDDLAVVTEPAAGPVDLVEHGLDGGPRSIEIAIGDDESDPRAEGAPVRDPRLGHDDPVAAWAVPVVAVGAAVDWVVDVEPEVALEAPEDVLVEPEVVLEVPPAEVDVSVETIAAVVTSLVLPS